MRPHFQVLAVTLAVITLLTLGVAKFRDHIPKGQPNRLSGSREPFLEQAKYQIINWQRLSDAPLAEARRAHRAILIFVGIPQSSLTRYIDQQVFTDREIAQYVSQNFVCIRIDAGEMPEWRSAFWPASRIPAGLLPECQLVVCDPTGNVLEVIGRTNESRFDLDQIRRQLKRASESVSREPHDPWPFRDVQRQDRSTLLHPSVQPVPAVREFKYDLLGRLSQSENLPIQAGLARPMPLVLRAVTSLGDDTDISNLFDRILTSPLYDPVQGMFYRASLPGTMQVSGYDVSTVENADMALALAAAGRRLHDAVLLRAASVSFDWVAYQMDMNPGISPGIAYGGDEHGRSEFASFSIWPLRSKLSPQDYAYALKDLQIGDPANVQRIPILRMRSQLLDADFGRVQSALRLVNSRTSPLISRRYLDVEALCVSRLLATARLLNDPILVGRALQLFDDLADFHLSAGWSRALDTPDFAPATLSGLVAVADAYYQAFLATGRYEYFDTGIETLQEALKVNQIPGSDAFSIVPHSEVRQLGFQDVDVPQLMDDFTESSSARIMRMCFLYGTAAQSPALVQRGFRLMQTLSGAASGNYVGWLAGYYLSAATLIEGVILVPVGTNAMALASRLAVQYPGRPVIPAVGPAFRNLQSHAPGIYLLRGTQVVGPLTEERLQERLAVTIS